jgi:hypothetical protein
MPAPIASYKNSSEELKSLQENDVDLNKPALSDKVVERSNVLLGLLKL